MEKFSVVGFLLRLFAALLLVFLTFNPTGHSFYHWAAAGSVTPLVAVAGIALLIVWGIFITATARSMGLIGVVITLLFLGAIVWLIASWGWLNPHNAGAMTWVVLFACGIVLAIGMSWSHIRRRLTGQADVDEVDHK